MARFGDVLDAYGGGDPWRAAAMADSMYHALRKVPGKHDAASQALWLAAEALRNVGNLGPGAERPALEFAAERGAKLRRMALDRFFEVQVARAEEPAAIRIALENEDLIDGARRREVRKAARRLSVDELRSLMSEVGRGNGIAETLRAEFALALAEAGFPDSARAVASRVIADRPDQADSRTAESVLGKEGSVPAPSLRLGVLLPFSGRFAAVGSTLLDGVRVALDAYRRQPGSVNVELLVSDDSSRSEDDAVLLEELERQGVQAVIGPLRSSALGAVAGARRYAGLLVLSPTATEVRGVWPHAYSLWDRERRDDDVARDVGAWMASRLELERFGVLVPVGKRGSEVGRAFTRGVVREGGAVVAGIAYSPDSTTFSEPIGVLSASEPQAVFVATDRPQTVLQLGPQIAFFGLRSAILAGGANWADPAIVRRLQPNFADFRIVGSYTDRSTPRSAWNTFKGAYETLYNKQLPNNMLAALGHDAASLILHAAGADRPARVGPLARAARLAVLDGATGRLQLDERTSSVGRRTLIRMIRDRRLVRADPTEILAAAARARLREEEKERLRKEAEEKEKGEEEGGA